MTTASIWPAGTRWTGHVSGPIVLTLVGAATDVEVDVLGLGPAVVEAVELGELGDLRPVAHEPELALDARADHLVARDAVFLLREGADQVDAAARDDEGPEAVVAKVGEQLDLRPVDIVREQPMQRRVPRPRESADRNLVEVVGRGPRMGLHREGQRALLAEGLDLRGVALEERLVGLLVAQGRIVDREQP